MAQELPTNPELLVEEKTKLITLAAVIAVNLRADSKKQNALRGLGLKLINLDPRAGEVKFVYKQFEFIIDAETLLVANRFPINSLKIINNDIPGRISFSDMKNTEEGYAYEFSAEISGDNTAFHEGLREFIEKIYTIIFPPRIKKERRIDEQLVAEATREWPKRLEVVAYTEHAKPATTQQLHDEIVRLEQEFPENSVRDLLRYLPKQLADTVPEFTAEHAMPNILKDREINTPEDLITLMQDLADVLYDEGLIHKYFGVGIESRALCMNLESVILKLLTVNLGWQAFGVEQPENLEDISIRPIIAVLDRRLDPHYGQDVEESQRFSMEALIQINLGDRSFLVDYNYYFDEPEKYDQHRATLDRYNLIKQPGLMIEVTDSQESAAVLSELGLYLPAEFGGVDMPEDVSEYYTNVTYAESQSIGARFCLFWGHPYSLESIDNDDGNYKMITLSPQEFVNRLSSAALISSGLAPQDLGGGTGRMHLIPSITPTWEKARGTSIRNLAILSDPLLV